MDNDYTEYNESYYLHCVGILVKTLCKETGEKITDIDFIWDNYMFYPIEKSKAYDILRCCEIYDVKPDSAAKIKRVI